MEIILNKRILFRNLDFPILKKVGKKTLLELNFSDSVLRGYRDDEVISKYLSYFFNMQHKGEGERVLTRYYHQKGVHNPRKKR